MFKNQKIMNKYFGAMAVGSLMAISVPAFSQADHMTNGVVRKIDLENGKITIRHEEIKAFDMPPMTMVFEVKDRSMLNQVQVGQAVKFAVIQSGGKLVITELKAVQ